MRIYEISSINKSIIIIKKNTRKNTELVEHISLSEKVVEKNIYVNICIEAELKGFFTSMSYIFRLQSRFFYCFL